MSAPLRQSTRHVMMIEPVAFAFNPETAATNSYQSNRRVSATMLQKRAVIEHRHFRQELTARGVHVTLVRGASDSPDDVFCNNWVSTHQDTHEYQGRMILYPMLAENRRRERRPAIIDLLRKTYPNVRDLSSVEAEGKILESTGSLVLDRINRVAYAVISPRTHRDLVEMWCRENGYRAVLFDAFDAHGKPIYHTNVVMWVGSDVAGIALECIPDTQRARVEQELRATHDVVPLAFGQVADYAGNALEVLGQGARDLDTYLVMSKTAWHSLTSTQKTQIAKHYKDRVISADLSVIETHGGGSARCCLLELF